jgi:hypothetical protein
LKSSGNSFFILLNLVVDFRRSLMPSAPIT